MPLEWELNKVSKLGIDIFDLIEAKKRHIAAIR
jgi:hypothetical protein